MTTEPATARELDTQVASEPPRASHAEQSTRVPAPYRIFGIVLTAILVGPAIAFAQQSPWEKSANALNNAFTGTIGRALAPVAIIVGGLMWMFGEGGARRHIAALIMGGGMVLAATAFSNWLFGAS
jgi:type IV secretory pathway VirB2 component (pilin)